MKNKIDWFYVIMMVVLIFLLFVPVTSCQMHNAFKEKRAKEIEAAYNRGHQKGVQEVKREAIIAGVAVMENNEFKWKTPQEIDLDKVLDQYVEIYKTLGELLND